MKNFNSIRPFEVNLIEAQPLHINIIIRSSEPYLKASPWEGKWILALSFYKMSKIQIYKKKLWVNIKYKIIREITINYQKLQKTMGKHEV